MQNSRYLNWDVDKTRELLTRPMKERPLERRRKHDGGVRRRAKKSELLNEKKKNMLLERKT